MIWLRAFAVTLGFCLPALALSPNEVLDDDGLEARARAISSELRCLVCQNQSIDDSDADLARDLRIIVRERLVAGDSDADVLDFVVARYGEFVLLRPVLGPHTVLLWVAGPALLLIGLLAIWLGARRRRPVSGDLSENELKALSRLRDSAP